MQDEKLEKKVSEHIKTGIELAQKRDLENALVHFEKAESIVELCPHIAVNVGDLFSNMACVYFYMNNQIKQCEYLVKAYKKYEIDKNRGGMEGCITNLKCNTECLPIYQVLYADTIHKKEIAILRKEIADLKKEIADLKQEVHYSPGKAGFKEAEKNFDDTIKDSKQLSL